jgi:peptidoglycan/LPS O-acetylase OafA/YrhL
MAEKTTAFAELQAETKTTSRLFFIDHLRASLVILVVLHHVALVYGAFFPFYYLEPPYDSPLAGLVLGIFGIINQSFFMGALFLFSGYFTPGSFDRKGPASFLKDRLLRLGVPLLVFIFVLGPISCIGLFLMPSELTGITTPLTWQTFPYRTCLDMGPMWFLAMLLTFTFGYAAWRRLTGDQASDSLSKSSPPSYRRIVIFVLALAAVSYLVRIVIPIGRTVADFPTLSYLPQYLSFFVIGVISYRHNWLKNIPGSMGVVGFVMAAMAGIFLFPLALGGQAFSSELTETAANCLGNGHWQSAVYALWDSTFAVGMVLGLTTLFRRFFNGQGRFGRFLTQHSYTVYVIHTPIIVFLAFSLRGIELAHLAKFCLASVIIVPACFAVAYLVREIPHTSRIL